MFSAFVIFWGQILNRCCRCSSQRSISRHCDFPWHFRVGSGCLMSTSGSNVVSSQLLILSGGEGYINFRIGEWKDWKYYSCGFSDFFFFFFFLLPWGRLIFTYVRRRWRERRLGGVVPSDAAAIRAQSHDHLAEFQRCPLTCPGCPTLSPIFSPYCPPKNSLECLRLCRLDANVSHFCFLSFCLLFDSIWVMLGVSPEIHICQFVAFKVDDLFQMFCLWTGKRDPQHCSFIWRVLYRFCCELWIGTRASLF